MSFDAIAPHYRWLEFVTAGSLLQWCRTAFLTEFSEAKHILLLGEGRGRFLVELLKLNPSARITCLDASASMLSFTRDNLHSRGLMTDRVILLHASIPDLSGLQQPESGAPLFDAVASHFFLDCFGSDQLEKVIAWVASRTTECARWLVSDFCVPSCGWQRRRARLILAGLYLFFRIATRLPATGLTSPDKLLSQSGFRLKARKLFNHGLLHSDVWVKQLSSGSTTPRALDR